MWGNRLHDALLIEQEHNVLQQQKYTANFQANTFIRNAAAKGKSVKVSLKKAE